MYDLLQSFSIQQTKLKPSPKKKKILYNTLQQLSIVLQFQTGTWKDKPLKS